jgi:hypothetical protein
VATNDSNEPKVSRQQNTEDDTTRRGVYVPDETWRAAKMYAASQGITVSKVFELAVIQYIGEKQSNPPTKADVSARQALNSMTHLRETPKDKLHIA